MSSVAVPKCCPPFMSFYNSSRCQPTPGVQFSPRLYRLEDGPVPSPLNASSYTYQVPACRRYVLEPADEWYLLEDATLYFPTARPVLGNFCLENFGDDGVLLPVVCFESAPAEPELVFLPVGMLVSLPFMLATVLVYALLPQLRSLHGKTVISHVSSLLVSYSALATVQLVNYVDTLTCIILGFTIQYFFTSGFFWSNVMCYDIFHTFGGVSMYTEPGRPDTVKRFLKYSLYSWGCPLVFLLATVIVDNTRLVSPTSPLKPGFGNKQCFFEHAEARWLFFNGPIAVIVFSNCVMFSVTAWRILYHRRHVTAVLQSDDSRRHNKDKERFGLYLKLFVVMGVNWLFELLSWLLGGPDQIWYLSDVTNTLQGVFFFVILVCRRRTWRLLKARTRRWRWRWWRRRPTPHSPADASSRALYKRDAATTTATNTTNTTRTTEITTLNPPGDDGRI